MIAKLFYDKVVKVVKSSNIHIALHEPKFDEYDVDCVKTTILSNWVSYQGEMVKKFEDALSQYLDVPHIISVVNGTSALFILLKSLGISTNDEVLVPSLTFAATANAVCHVGAVPHFVDCELDTFAIDFNKIEKYLRDNTFVNNKKQLVNKNTNRVIKAIILVYVLGTPCNLEKLVEIAVKFNLLIIEDSAEALGSSYRNKKITSLTGVGILSFNGNKIITTGGGGVVAVYDEALATKIKHLVATAKKPHPYEFEHDEVGYNLRLPALNAALGFSQLKKIEFFLMQKRNLHNKYLCVFDGIKYGNMFNPHKFGQSNCWLNAFILHDSYSQYKNNILEFLNNKNIMVRPFWKPLHTLSVYKDCPRSDCSTAQNLYERVICLPSSAFLDQYA